MTDQSQESYRATIKELSDRIVEAQRPIKVLSGINWDDQVKEDFFAAEFKEQPKVDHAYYMAREIKLDPDEARAELLAIEADVAAQLGPLSSAGKLMRFMCEQFRLTVDMIEGRGTSQFSDVSKLLYG
ncbi:MAG TPA: tyrosine/phenylalanine carboxypeptidase domain-containing protein, partial [Acidimicrobiia bacterium]|nr:tyrosine/phenylalanine carboxypeptidase domain-containing protein [Acidimicrobiia bacterium]